jgi:hypothetical protein
LLPTVWISMALTRGSAASGSLNQRMPWTAVSVLASPLKSLTQYLLFVPCEKRMRLAPFWFPDSHMEEVSDNLGVLHIGAGADRFVAGAWHLNARTKLRKLQ